MHNHTHGRPRLKINYLEDGNFKIITEKLASQLTNNYTRKGDYRDYKARDKARHGPLSKNVLWLGRASASIADFWRSEEIMVETRKGIRAKL